MNNTREIKSTSVLMGEFWITLNGDQLTVIPRAHHWASGETVAAWNEIISHDGIRTVLCARRGKKKL